VEKKLIYGLTGDQIVNLATSNLELQLFHIEQLLNRYSGKRYHIRESLEGKTSLIEIIKFGKEKTIVKDLTTEQMFSWLQKHLRLKVDQR